MGFVTRTLRKVMYATNQYVDPKTSILLELGDQNAFNNLTLPEKIDKYRIKGIMHAYFKEYHTLDLKGEDIIKTDLSEYTPDLFKANIITNIGTTEHVELEEGQWNCWRNLHNWLNVGGKDILHLSEAKKNGNNPANTKNTFDHMAFSAEDKENFIKILRKKDIEFYLREVPEIGTEQIFFKDPVGNGIELIFCQTK